MAPSENPENPHTTAAVEESGGSMSFFDHLVELRKRLISSLLGIGIGMMVGLAFSKPGLAYIVVPMTEALKRSHLDPNLYFTHPAGDAMGSLSGMAIRCAGALQARTKSGGQLHLLGHGSVCLWSGFRLFRDAAAGADLRGGV
jgi:hypothetical protein